MLTAGGESAGAGGRVCVTRGLSRFAEPSDAGGANGFAPVRLGCRWCVDVTGVDVTGGDDAPSGLCETVERGSAKGEGLRSSIAVEVTGTEPAVASKSEGEGSRVSGRTAATGC